jgi:tetratricopeptide (TPR) repeat protein
LELCNQLKRDEHIFFARAYYYIGRIQSVLCQFAEAETKLKKALHIALVMNNQYELSRIKFRIAELDVNRGSWEGAKVLYKEALDLANKNRQYLLAAKIHNHLVWVTSFLGLYNESTKHIEEAKQNLDELTNNPGLHKLDRCNIEDEPDSNELEDLLLKIRQDKLVPELRQMLIVQEARLNCLSGSPSLLEESCSKFNQLEKVEDISVKIISKTCMAVLHSFKHRHRENAKKMFGLARNDLHVLKREELLKWPTRILVAIMDLSFFEAYVYYIYGQVQEAQNVIKLCESDLSTKQLVLKSSDEQNDNGIPALFISRYCGRLQFVKAQLLIEQSQFEDADEKFNTLIYSDPWTVMAKRYLLGYRYYYLKDYKTALEWFSEAIEQQIAAGYSEDHYEVMKTQAMKRACETALSMRKSSDQIS